MIILYGQSGGSSVRTAHGAYFGRRLLPSFPSLCRSHPRVQQPAENFAGSTTRYCTVGDIDFNKEHCDITATLRSHAFLLASASAKDSFTAAIIFSTSPRSSLTTVIPIWLRKTSGGIYGENHVYVPNPEIFIFRTELISGQDHELSTIQIYLCCLCGDHQPLRHPC